MFQTKAIAPLLLPLLAALSAPTYAGPYADDLSKCLVSSTTEADKAQLIKWMFSAISLNKDVAPFVDMPDEVRSDVNRDTAGVYMRLLTESCRSQTHEAYKYEGEAAVHSAFELLGRVASQGMFADPAVAEGLEGLTDHFDEEKLGAVLQGE